jgi:hypothetical protein
MAEHEPCVGASDDWYTPPEIFDRLELIFDLDPCSPGPGHWVPARHIFTKADDGLSRHWSGLVFMNPPFGGRNGHVPWLQKFLEHGNGIAVVRAYTSSAWFHEWAVRAETMCFPRGKTQFIPSPELRAELERKSKSGKFHNAPGHGIVLLGMGETANAALLKSGLGLTVMLNSHPVPRPKSSMTSAGSATACMTARSTRKSCGLKKNNRAFGTSLPPSDPAPTTRRDDR